MIDTLYIAETAGGAREVRGSLGLPQWRAAPVERNGQTTMVISADYPNLHGYRVGCIILSRALYATCMGPLADAKRKAWWLESVITRLAPGGHLIAL